jgi:hypothetical protein
MTGLMTAELKRSIPIIERRRNMNLSAPKNSTFWVAIVVAVVGLIASFGWWLSAL